MKIKTTKEKAIAKTITWRIIASLTTFVLAQAFGLSLEKSIYITSIEFILKLVFYYWHERAWQRVRHKVIRKKIR